MVDLLPVREVRRSPAPGIEPMGLAFHRDTLWLSCRESQRLYAIDPDTLQIREEIATPGAPFGLVFFHDVLHVVIGYGSDDDDRVISRYTPEHGFADSPFVCPDRSGVHLATDGTTLYLSQAHDRCIVGFDANGTIERTIALERVPVGMTIVDANFYLVNGDRNFADLQFGRLDMHAPGPIVPLGAFAFNARGVAFDGTAFWTADRRANAIVVLETPTLPT
jgi:hypothetical protein